MLGVKLLLCLLFSGDHDLIVLNGLFRCSRHKTPEQAQQHGVSTRLL